MANVFINNNLVLQQASIVKLQTDKILVSKLSLTGQSQKRMKKKESQNDKRYSFSFKPDSHSGD